MEDLRCVRYETTAEIIEATKAYDDGFTNLSLGSFYEYLGSAAAVQPSDPAYFLAVYRGDDLLLTLAHHALARAWQLVCPQSAEHLLTLTLLVAATQQLAGSLLAVAHPSVLTSVYGHDGAVTAFVKAWQALVEKEGTHLRIAPNPIMVTRSSYATRESLTPSLNTPASFNITQATERDFEEIFPLHLDFMSLGPGPRALAVEEADLRRTIASGTMWICRDGPSTAGYIITSRSTPRTIAVRNVYVSPDHRRKGVASFMVRAMSRYHLGVRPAGYEGVPDGLPDTGVKDIVCINVVEPDTERIYRRAGFLFPEPTGDGSSRGGVDPVSGQKAWFPSVWLGFEPQSAP